MTARFRSLPIWCCALLLLLLRAPCAFAVNADWTTPIPPFRIADNLFYVGSRDLAAYLITTPQGNILLNANYTSSPPQIRHSVEQLGFHWKDTRILLISHAHIDHAGGAAQILRETGAQLQVMEGDVETMETGGKSDFAFGGSPGSRFAPAHVSRTLHNGDVVTLGGVSLTAHRTPGHTPGCTTWTLKVHLPGEPAGRLRDVVIVGSWSVLSEYRLLDVRGGKPASYPGIANDYTVTFATLAPMPCDVFLASHGSLFDMQPKLQRLPAEGARVWVDPDEYHRAVAEGQHAFEAAYHRQLDAAAVASGNR